MAKNTLTKKIEKSQSRDDKKTRDYIGASIIGSDCLRQIWYEYNGYEAESVPTKTRRTWAIGKHLEGLIINWLIEAGMDITTTCFDFEADGMPFFKGHLDSVWTKKDGTHAIIEIKTAKDASFNIFAKKGLYMWNTQYYSQIQAYMGMSGIHTAYILVLNKDNSELADEMITFDLGFYEMLCHKAKIISKEKNPPDRIHESPIWYQCKLCKFNKVCHK